MKMMIIATVVAGSVALSQPAQANARGHHERNHSPIKELVQQLHGLSLTTAQKAEIKSLVVSFKQAHVRPERPEPPTLTSVLSASQESIRAHAESKISEQQTLGLTLATLRSQVFALLTDAQQTTLLTRAEKFRGKRDEKRPPRGVKSAHSKPQRGPFAGIQLSEQQRESLHALKASFKDTMQAHKATMKAFREAQAELIHSGTFSTDAFEAVALRYHDAMVDAEVDKALNRQAMLAVLTDEQIATLEKLNEERAFFRQLLKPR